MHGATPFGHSLVHLSEIHNEISDRRRKDSKKREEKQRMTGRDMDHRENQQ